MSFDKNLEGYSFATAAVTDLTTVVPATFDGGKADVESATLKIRLDTSAATAVVDIATDLPVPNTMGACPGAELVIVKDNPGGFGAEFTDPEDGRVLTYVDKKDDTITLIADTANNRWTWKG